jgi:Helix-turn-helix.
MKYLNELLKELGISKVKMARYLGVSRQMVYNYLEMKSIEEWPKDKKIKLLLLFGVDEFKDIQI